MSRQFESHQEADMFARRTIAIAMDVAAVLTGTALLAVPFRLILVAPFV